MSLVEGVGNLDGGHIGIEDGRDGNVWCLGTIAWVSTIMVSSLSVPIGVLQRYPPGATYVGAHIMVSTYVLV